MHNQDEKQNKQSHVISTSHFTYKTKRSTDCVINISQKINVKVGLG